MTRNKFLKTIFYLLIFAVNFQNSSRAQELIPTLQNISAAGALQSAQVVEFKDHKNRWSYHVRSHHHEKDWQDN